MDKLQTIIASVIILASLASCSDKDDNDSNSENVAMVKVDTINVDVILPSSILDNWQQTIDWAQENIAMAQKMEKRQVTLKLRYHNEDTEDLDRLAYNLMHPETSADTCHAIIGPYYSDHATTFLSYAAQTRTPVVMPTCTNGELQRINARNTYAWFLTESDITQCEIMFSAIRTMGGKKVALVYSDDSYGKTFYDWFNFLATENDLTIVGEPTSYHSGDNLYDFLRQAAIDANSGNTMLCLALSNPEDYVLVSDEVENYMSDPAPGAETIFNLMCSDKALSEEVVNNEYMRSFIGISPVGAIAYGFPQDYRERFGRLPYNGEAQLYDALCLIAFGAVHQIASPQECLVNNKQVAYKSKPYGPGLTDYMRSVVTSFSTNDSLVSTLWNANGLATVFHELHKGNDTNILHGSSGDLYFDNDSQTKIVNSNYMVWTVEKNYNENSTNLSILNKIVPLCYLSTGGGSSTVSTNNIWEKEKRWQQKMEEMVGNVHELPHVVDYWAVVISPSTTWANYRHQADAFAMYQTLRQHGYDDDHIILIVEDNLANDSRNSKFPGQIFVERSDDENLSDMLVNFDVRKNAKVDYHFSDLTPDDVGEIMLGHQSDRLPYVIHPDSTSDVFFFWSGHGGSGEGPLWGNEDAYSYFGAQRINDIVTQMNTTNSYRRMMFAIETCFSGKWGEALTGQPDVIVLTAANGRETSKADVHNSELGVFLSNAFARTFRQFVNQKNTITLRDLYIELAKTTNGSHVSIYNEKEYGSVYTNNMQEYFPK
ncbi:MAG: ABC transporter substrate-binding protein [Prevotella sp.]|nr:ABC transporter substrate-binding protein [Prevotella sp.]